MPELPEVETVKRGIAPILEGNTLTKIITRRDKIRIAIPQDFISRCEGQEILQVVRKAKYLLLYLGSGDVIICHLGMSGRISLTSAKARKEPDIYEKHDHVIFETDKGDLVIYNDPRRFGIMTICHENDLETHRFFKDMGSEPLGNEFNGSSLYAKLKSKKTTLKTALLDQRVVVGMGNIYVCEALFDTGIAPERRACDLGQNKCEELVRNIREILERAIKAGGSTLKDYAQVDGELGYFQHSFKVYGREGEQCATKGCSAPIERITQSGRSTFYCPRCQN